MKNAKKSLCLLISVLLIFSSLPVISFASDYEAHWAKDAINLLINSGVVSGDADGSIRPDDKILRAEFVKVINKYFGYKNIGVGNFRDVENGKWYYNEFAIAKAQGYITGDNYENANPEAYITRAEVSVILSRILKLTPNSNVFFNDNDSIPEWAKGYIGAMVENGLLSGYGDGTIQAQNNITRAESFSLISRILKSDAATERTGNTNSMVGVNSVSVGGGGDGGGGGSSASSGSGTVSATHATVSLRNFAKETFDIEINAVNAASFTAEIDVSNGAYTTGQFVLPAIAASVANVYKVNLMDKILEILKSRIATLGEAEAQGEMYIIKVKAIGASGYYDSDEVTLVMLPVMFEKIAAPEISTELDKENSKVLFFWNIDSKASSYEVKVYDESGSDITSNSNVTIDSMTGKVEINGLSDVFANKYSIEVSAFGSNLILDSEKASLLMDPDKLPGEGTAESPYVVKYPEQFKKIANNPASNYIIIADMTLTEEEIISVEFTGTLEGRLNYEEGKKPLITLDISIDESNIGMFKKLGEGAVVKNLSIDGDVYGLGNVGTVAGEAYKATIENCDTTANVSSETSNAGGFAGILNGGVIKTSSNHGEVYAVGDNAGGIAGKANGEIKESYNTGNIISDASNAGGILGISDGDKIIIADCYNLGLIEGSANVAGIVGVLDSASEIKLVNTYNIGKTTSDVAPVFAVAYAATNREINSNYYSDLVGQSTNVEAYIADESSDAKQPEEIALNVMSSMGSYSNFSSDIWKIYEDESFIFPQLINNKNTVKLDSLPAVTGITVTGNTVSFNPVTNASSYTVMVYSEIGELVETATITETSVQISNFTFNEEYKIIVIAEADGYVSLNYVIEAHNNIIGINRPKKVVELSHSYSFTDGEAGSDANDQENIILSWKGNDDATGYKVVFKKPDGAEIDTKETTEESLTYDFSKTIGAEDETILYEVYTMNNQHSSVAVSGKMDILFGGGEGLVNNPYIIYTQRHYMNLVRKYETYSDFNFVQCADIYTPATEYIPAFSGSYIGVAKDGEASFTHRILNVNIEESKTWGAAGMIRNGSGAEIRNIRLQGSVALRAPTGTYPVREGSSYTYTAVGGFIAAAGGGSALAVTIDNCINEANIYVYKDLTGDTLGGLSGSANSYAVGGIIGSTYSLGTSNITNCINAGSINTAASRVGGIHGHASVTKLENCANFGDIKGASSVGGISGDLTGGKIIKCANKGTIVSNSDAAGGIVGSASGGAPVVSECYNEGAISIGAKNFIGGIVGKAHTTGGTLEINNSLNKGTVTSNESSKRGSITSAVSRTVSEGLGIKIYNCISLINMNIMGDASYDAYSAKIAFNEAGTATPSSNYYEGNAVNSGKGGNAKSTDEIKNILFIDTSFSSSVWDYGADGYPMLKNAPDLDALFTEYQLIVNGKGNNEEEGGDIGGGEDVGGGESGGNDSEETIILTTSYAYEDNNTSGSDASDKENLLLSWTPSTKATGYKVVIKKADDTTLLETDITETEYKYDFTDVVLQSDTALKYEVSMNTATGYVDIDKGEMDITFGGGEGSIDKPYVINNARHYMNLVNNYEKLKNLNFIQQSDIYTAVTEPIPEFSGSYIGVAKEGEANFTHRVLSVTVEKSETWGAAGMILNGSGAEVRNMRLKGSVTLKKPTGTADIRGNGKTYSNMGGFIAAAAGKEAVVVDNCINEASLTIYSDLEGTTIGGINNYDSNGVGGIIGSTYQLNTNGTITNCINTGNINTVTSRVGGIHGHATVNKIENCINFGDIEGASSVGGISGDLTGGEIIKCANKGTIYGKSDGAGGIVGAASGGAPVVSECYNEGAISIGAKNFIGGIVGKAHTTGGTLEINNSLNKGTVTSNESSKRGSITSAVSRTVSEGLGIKIYNCISLINMNIMGDASYDAYSAKIAFNEAGTATPSSNYYEGDAVDSGKGGNAADSDELKSVLSTDTTFDTTIWDYDSETKLPILINIPDLDEVKEQYGL